MRDNRRILLITLDGKGYALIKTYALINTGIKQQKMIAIAGIV